MARTLAVLPPGSRLSDHITLGVVAKTFPVERVQAVLARTGKESERQRQLPAHVVLYYVIALPLFMGVSTVEVLRELLEGFVWLGLGAWEPIVTGKSGISKARTRLGAEPLKQLHDQLVLPVAVKDTHGAWFHGWRVVSLDGSVLDVADTVDNATAFERPGAHAGRSAFPQIRFVSLVENGTHVLYGSRMGGCRTSEQKLAREVLPRLTKGCLCLADRNFYGFALWRRARRTGADLLWRVKTNLRLPVEKRLPDGSYESRVYASEADRRRKRGAQIVRVIEYTLDGVADAEPLYRLITTIRDPKAAPAAELAALYHERWEIETALGELKVHLRGRGIVLRSKTPELVRQEFWGFLLAHFAVRGLMHEAALKGGVDPDELSFVHAVRVVRRRLPAFAAFPPSAARGAARADTEGAAGGAGGQQPGPQQPAGGQAPQPEIPQSLPPSTRPGRPNQGPNPA